MRDASAEGGTAVKSATVDVDPRCDERWADLVAEQRSDVFHSPAWARVLSDGYGFDVRARLVPDSAGQPVAGIPYVDVDDFRGSRRISLPFSDFCDPLGEGSDCFPLLAESLLSSEGRAHMRCLQAPAPPGDLGWEETGNLAWHRVDVARSEDEVWDALHSSGRRAIRRARSTGVDVAPATTEAELRRFFEMHLRVRKHKYGLLAQPYRFFEAIWEHFLSVGQGQLLLARVGSEVVGGVLYLRWKDTLYYKFNASESTKLDVRPNDLLVWEGLAHAREEGLSWFDFGVSDWDQEGLVRYKRKYATEEGTVHKYSAGSVRPDPVTPLLGELTGLLTDPTVPDQITEKAGDSLYRFFC